MNQASAGGIGIANAQAGALMQATATLNAVDLHSRLSAKQFASYASCGDSASS
jgi:hypothetical protein